MADMKRDDTSGIVEHVVYSIRGAREIAEPFALLQLASVFPDELYRSMLEALPRADDYRPMSGRTKYTRTGDGGGTRVKMDLFPESLRPLSADKRPLWRAVGWALRSRPVREAFCWRLGGRCRERRLFAAPTLMRDIAGYNIGIHPDTRWKGITVQFYLPPDRSIEHIGTVFHRRSGAAFERVLQLPFAPNTGYAFAVGPDTYHSVDLVGPEVRSRDSLMLTYYLDDTFAQRASNRGKRFGNFLLGEWRSLARQP